MKASLYTVSMNILEAMAYHLNFSFRIIEPPDKRWGIYRNGTWTGIMKQLQERVTFVSTSRELKRRKQMESGSYSREVDLAAAALTISDDRAKVLDYLLPPYITTYVDVLYRKDDEEDYSWLLLLEPFQSSVLLVLAACVIVVLLLYGVLELLQRHSGDTRRTHVFWFVVGSFLKQASTHTFSHASAKILTSFWWIFLIVISSVYTARLVALFSVKKSKPPPFTNLLELSQRHDYTIGFPMVGFPAAFVQNSKREDIAGIWKRITQRNMTDPRVSSTDFDYHVNQIKSGKYAAIMPGFIAQSYKAKVCGLALLGERFLFEQMTFGVPKSSPLKPEFERAMQTLTDSGLIDKWIRETNSWSNRSQCIPEQTRRTVTLANVGGGIVAAAAGAGFALLTLAAECLYHYTRTQS